MTEITCKVIIRKMLDGGRRATMKEIKTVMEAEGKSKSVVCGKVSEMVATGELIFTGCKGHRVYSLNPEYTPEPVFKRVRAPQPLNFGVQLFDSLLKSVRGPVWKSIS